MPRPRLRRILFASITLLGVALVIEGLGRVAYRYAFGDPYRLADLTETTAADDAPDLLSLAQTTPASKLIRRNILHPYVGFTANGTDRDHGFPSKVDVLAHRAPGRKVVAVVGGSVANAVAPILETVLRESMLPGVELVFVDLTKKGFKQPQQLLLVSFLLSVGAQYDVVINLDGYNEAVLPLIENYRAGTFPFFPRHWEAQIDRSPSTEALIGIGTISYLRERQRALREGFEGSGLGWSGLAGFLVRLRIDALDREIAFAEQSLQNLPRAGFEAHGPFRAYPSLGPLGDDMLAVWRRSSELLAAVVRDSGGVYFHFLQPNQYLEGSKPISARERAKAMLDGAHRQLVERLYPRMRNPGPSLDGQAARFIDATQVFADQPQTLYIDACCHVNQMGNTLIAEFIARALSDAGVLAAAGSQ